MLCIPENRIQAIQDWFAGVAVMSYSLYQRISVAVCCSRCLRCTPNEYSSECQGSLIRIESCRTCTLTPRLHHYNVSPRSELAESRADNSSARIRVSTLGRGLKPRLLSVSPGKRSEQGPLEASGSVVTRYFEKPEHVGSMGVGAVHQVSRALMSEWFDTHSLPLKDRTVLSTPAPRSSGFPLSSSPWRRQILT